MNGVSETSVQGYEPAVFDSIIDTYPGGVNVDTTGYTNVNGVIPKGTAVTVPDETTGLSKVGAAALAEGQTLLGHVMATVKIDDNPLVGVAISGTVISAQLPADEKAAVADLKTALPRFLYK